MPQTMFHFLIQHIAGVVVIVELCAEVHLKKNYFFHSQKVLLIAAK